MFSTLTITPRNTHLCVVGFHRVVASAEFAGVEQHAQNLHVMLCGYAGDNHAHDEQADSAEQGMEKREYGAPGDQSDEKQSPLRSEDSQRAVHGLKYRAHPHARRLRHGSPPLFLCSWKEPSHEVD